MLSIGKMMCAMTEIVDFAEARSVREAIRAEARDGTERFLSAVEQAARGSADVAWLLARPVRSDDSLTRDLNRLMMRRLRTNIRFQIRQITDRADLRAHWTKLVCDMAEAIFTKRIFDLQDEHCIGGLSDEIRGCSRGGSSEKSGWVFT